MTLASPPLRVVLYEGPGAQPLENERRLEVMSTLLEAGYPLTRPTDNGSVTPADAAPLVVLGQFEDGQTPEIQGQGQVHVQELNGLDSEALVERIAAIREGAELPQPGAWTPWFPVIDYQRCTNCMQCLSFCLFDVYGVDSEGQIDVRNEEKCKTNCPACSRVCPEVAILFPKYKKGPINGDVVRAEDIQSESMKVDISALLGGDIYASLRTRKEESKKRFSTERDESKALLERKRCLKELKETLDIPDEVLMTLPSAGDIEERARRAKEKMEKRMQLSQTKKDQAPPVSEEEWGI
jgi:NAD-dependent dihydropyrimidine dehydrogenase PreA subunit